MHFKENERLEEETYKVFNLILRRALGTDPANFGDVCMKDIAAVEDIVQADFFLYDIDIVHGSTLGEIARRTVEKHFNTVRLSRYESHICCASNINAPFKGYRCPSCDHFIKTVYHLERHLITYKEN